MFDFLMGKREAVSGDEIKDIVADNEDLLEDEKRMIHDILDLGDMSVHEIMQPRVDMMIIEDVESGRAALERMGGRAIRVFPCTMMTLTASWASSTIRTSSGL